MDATKAGRFFRGALFTVWLLAPVSVAAQSAETGSAVVTVAPVTSQDFVAQTWMSGSIVPVNPVAVVPQISGYPVTSVLVDIGDVVAAGDVLAIFDDAETQAALDQIDAQIESAQASVGQAESAVASTQALLDQASTTLSRTQTLTDRGDLSQSSLDDALAAQRTAQANVSSATQGVALSQAQLRQQQAARVAAALALEHAELTAPVSGVIATRDLDQGDLASMTGSAFVIYEDGALEVAAQVVETALGALTTGDDVTISIAGLADRTGAVRLIAPTVDDTTRLGEVRITLDDATGVRAGLFASGWIMTDQRSSLSVPVTAVQTDAEGTYVLVVNDGVLARTPVEAGLTAGDQREILSGLTDGQTVVARAGGFFADGDTVTPLAQDAAQ